MRAPRHPAGTAAAVLAAVAVLLLSASLVLAKEGGIVTLAAPIPRDAEPGSTITVIFKVAMPGGDGTMSPVTGSPVVIKLIGDDGTRTEAMGAERGTPGTYTARIRVPASGITNVEFGLRGTGTMADGTTSIVDIPFAVDGLLFTTTAHPAPAAAAGSTPTVPAASTSPDYRPAIVAGLVAVAIVGLGLALVVGRRRARTPQSA